MCENDYESLRKLALLESQPFTTWDQTLEWYRLRKWVLDNDLITEYRNQHYFLCSEEITKIELAPKKSSSMFSRFLDLFKK